MGLFSNRINREDVRRGDHIYSWRTAYAYAHHGIYVGDDKVVHFRRGRGEKVGTGTAFDQFVSTWGRSRTPHGHVCQACNLRQDSNGVVCSCLDCFLAGGALYRFEYAVGRALFLVKTRGGTCTLAESDPPETVVQRATYLLKNGFGRYNILNNNCEDFAIYCMTGLVVIDTNGIGRSGQVASVLAANFSATITSPFWFWTTNICGLSVVAVGLYCLTRYATDIRVRGHVSKVAVEDLAVRLALNDTPSDTIKANNW